MIVQPQTLAVFALAALAILAVPGPAVIYIVTRSIHQGRAAGLASVLGIHVGTLVHLRSRRRALGDPRLVGDRVHRRQGARGAVPDRDRDQDAARPRRPGGHRPAAAAAQPPPRLRRGRRRQHPQSEDGALLPRVPAAVRRPGPRPAVAADPRARAHVHAARARHRLDVGARRRLGRRDAAEEPPLGAGAALRLGLGLRRARAWSRRCTGSHRTDDVLVSRSARRQAVSSRSVSFGGSTTAVASRVRLAS